MSRFVFIRKVQIWFGFTCQQVPPPPRYLSRSKCQLLTVSRNAYKTLVEERVRVNSAFVRTAIDQQAVESLPENGVPQQLIECGVQMPEVDKYSATRCGPGTLRDPLDKTQEDDDASDEISDASSNDGHTEGAPFRSGKMGSVLPHASRLWRRAHPARNHASVHRALLQPLRHARVGHLARLRDGRSHLGDQPQTTR